MKMPEIFLMRARKFQRNFTTDLLTNNKRLNRLAVSAGDMEDWNLAAG